MAGIIQKSKREREWSFRKRPVRAFALRSAKTRLARFLRELNPKEYEVEFIESSNTPPKEHFDLAISSEPPWDIDAGLPWRRKTAQSLDAVAKCARNMDQPIPLWHFGVLDVDLGDRINRNFSEARAFATRREFKDTLRGLGRRDSSTKEAAPAEEPIKSPSFNGDLEDYFSRLMQTTGRCALYSCFTSNDRFPRWSLLYDATGKSGKPHIKRHFSSWAKREIDQLFSLMPKNQALPYKSALVRSGSMVFEQINKAPIKSFIVQRAQTRAPLATGEWYLLLLHFGAKKRKPLKNQDQAALSAYTESLLNCVERIVSVRKLLGIPAAEGHPYRESRTPGPSNGTSKSLSILQGKIQRMSSGIATCRVEIAKGQWVNTTIPDERFHRVKLKRGEKFLWYAEEQLARPVGSPANAAVMEKAARAKQAKEDWMKIQEMHRKKPFKGDDW